MKNLMPAIFVGHGNPMNALLSNDYTKGWAVIGTEVPRPKAVLAVSAHWYFPGTSEIGNLWVPALPPKGFL